MLELSKHTREPSIESLGLRLRDEDFEGVAFNLSLRGDSMRSWGSVGFVRRICKRRTRG